MSYPKTTVAALADARQHTTKTKRDHVLLALDKIGGAEGWVGALTLSRFGGLRFGGRIFELRNAGVRIEARAEPGSRGNWQYRLEREDGQED